MAQRGAAAQHRVALAHGGEGTDAELGEVELPLVRAAVQFLDVEQYRLDAKRRIHEPVRQRVEGEGVVRAGRVAEAQRTHAAIASTRRGVAAVIAAKA